MMNVIDAYLLPIIIALVIGLAVGWWMFRRRSGTTQVEHRPADMVERRAPEPEPVRPVTPPPMPTARDAREGNGIADQGAAATADVAGEVLGVRAHAELPGAGGPPDDLQQLKGVGPKLALRLNELGVTRFDQLSRLSANEVAILDEKMGPFRGRLARDRLVEQAAYLARDDRDGFEATFGKLGSGA